MGPVSRLGQLQIDDSGFVYWVTPWGNLSPCQFHDNILMATSFPDSPHVAIVSKVCCTLRTAWNLKVLCPCDDHCTHQCVAHGLHPDPARPCLDFVQPGSLNSQWALKLGPPLISPHAAYSKYLNRIFTGVLCNAQPWCRSPVCQMMSVAAWCQFVILSGYHPKLIRRAMHSAIVCNSATTHHDATKCVSFLNHILPKLPMHRCCHIKIALRWIRGNRFLTNNQYATCLTGLQSMDFQGIGQGTIPHSTNTGGPKSRLIMCVCV